MKAPSHLGLSPTNSTLYNITDFSVRRAMKLLKPAEYTSEFECPDAPDSFPDNRFRHL